MHSIRKYILELTRTYPEITGYNITAIVDVPITSSGVFAEGMVPKLAPEAMQKINGEIVVSFSKDLGRIWKNGGDRFLAKDLYNYFSADDLAGRLVLSNHKGMDLNGTYEVSLVSGNDVYFQTAKEFSLGKYQVGELANLRISLPQVEKATRCELKVHLTYADGEYINSWDIWLYPRALTSHPVYLLDHSGSLEGIESLFNVTRLTSSTELEELQAGDVLITTAFDRVVKNTAERGINVIALQKGEGYFPLTYGPFYREGVKAIMSHPLTESWEHLGYAGLQFFGVGTDKFFDKLAMERVVGKFTPLVRRYDARKFHVGDYLLTFPCGTGQVVVTTLNLDGGQGSQPLGFEYNPFAIWLLHSIISYLS